MKSVQPNSEVFVLGVFLSESGRLPQFAQRRLNALIEKKKSEGLSRPEQRELTEALEYIEDKSIQLLAYSAEISGRDRPTKRSGRSVLWKRYVDRRFRQLCAS